MISSIKLEINSGATVYQNSEGHYPEEFIARCFRNYDQSVLNQMGESFFVPVNQYGYTISGSAVQVQTDPSVLSRGASYCLSGTNTQNREVTKIISFLDLFPRMSDSIYKNVRKVKITIVWVNNKMLLDNFSSVTALTGAVTLIGADIVTDFYIPTGSQVNETIGEKVIEQLDDYLPMLETQHFHQRYTTGSDIIIPSIKNFHSVFIMQWARGLNNGQAGTDLRTYAGHGEMNFGSVTTANATLIKTQQWIPTGVPAGAVGVPISSVQIVLGGQSYPDQPIDTIRGALATASFDGTGLYHQYLLALNRFGDRFRSGAIDFETFQSCMPFIYLCPFTNSAVKPSPEGRDLIIKLKGGETTELEIVVFKVKVVTLAPSGVASDY
jgi:hypothetical protein